MSYHIPILLPQVISALQIADDGIYLDGTLGGGGHTGAILAANAKARVVAIDRDPDAINNAQELKKQYGNRLTIIKGNFKNALEYLQQNNIKNLDGALLDLGISSHQVDTPDRGFSYRHDAPLDMRFDSTDSTSLTAYDIINTYSEYDLANTIYAYGEERASRRIAALIVQARKTEKIKTTFQLNNIIKKCVPFNPKAGHPSKKTFQALRIATNSELENLDKAVYDIAGILKNNARFCVITFHSLEDRIIKNAFKILATNCICDKSYPICTCNHKATMRLVDKITPDSLEQQQNKRSQSAILRIAEKL